MTKGVTGREKQKMSKTVKRSKPGQVMFEATIPALQSAITIAGDGGARLKLDVPESEMEAVARLLALRGQVLRVTVEVE